MKRFTAILSALLIMLSLCSCVKPAKGEDSALDGVSAELQSIDTKTLKNGSTVFETSVLITNGSDKAIMKVNYDLDVMDKNGNILHSFNFSYLDPEGPIQPGKSVVDKKGFQQVLDGKPAKAAVSVKMLYDETEIAAVHLPKSGEFLYKCLNDDSLANIDTKFPASVFIRIDQGGYERVADLQTEEEIKEAVDLFTKITVLDETYEFVTDNYNSVTFYFDDGTSKSVSLNLKNLEVNYYNQEHLYTLNNFDPFWAFAESVVQDEIVQGGS